jgi:hypothetical protein
MLIWTGRTRMPHPSTRKTETRHGQYAAGQHIHVPEGSPWVLV